MLKTRSFDRSFRLLVPLLSTFLFYGFKSEVGQVRGTMASFRRKNTEKAGLWRQLERCESLTPVSPKVNNSMSEYTSVEERVSYGIGRQMGDQLASNPVEGLSIDAVLAGLADSLNGAPSAVEHSALQEAFNEMHQRIQAREAEKAKELSAEGEKFLAENAKREEVSVTESGLQYEVLVAGDENGEKPGPNSTVRTHYHGTLLNGSVFDSSVDRGEPIEFPVNGVIAGWTEALQLMTVGSKWKLFIPYNLAYGAQGAGGAIGPYATLVFEVELLAVS